MGRDVKINVGAKNNASSVFSGVLKSAKGMQSGLRGVSVGLTNAGRSLATFGTVAVGVTGGALSTFIGSASESQETMGKFSVVFGDSAKEMEKWGDSTADAMGVSEDAMAGMLSGMQDLLVPMGVVPDVASGMSKELSKLAIDLGSFNNMDSDRVMGDLMAAMTGSGEVMKKYGVILSEASVKQELLNQKLDPKAATNAQKAQARLAIIMRGTTAAQGDAIRTADSFANQSKRLGAVLSDVSGMIGGVLIDDVAHLTGMFVGAGKSLKSFIADNQGFVKAAVATAVGVGVVGTAAVGIGVAMIGAGAAVSGFAAVVGAVLSPVGLIVGGIAIAGLSLGAAFAFAAHKTGILSGVMDAAKKVLADVWATAKVTFEGISNALKAGDWQLSAQIAWAGIKVAFWQGLGNIATAFASMMPKMWETVKHFFTRFVSVAWESTKTVSKILANPMSAAMEAANFVSTGLSFGGTDTGIAGYMMEQTSSAKAELASLMDAAKTQATSINETMKTGLDLGGSESGIAEYLKDQTNNTKAEFSGLKTFISNQTDAIKNNIKTTIGSDATAGGLGDKIKKEASKGLADHVLKIKDIEFPSLGNLAQNIINRNGGENSKEKPAGNSNESQTLQANVSRLLTGRSGRSENEQRRQEAKMRERQLQGIEGNLKNMADLAGRIVANRPSNAIEMVIVG